MRHLLSEQNVWIHWLLIITAAFFQSVTQTYSGKETPITPNRSRTNSFPTYVPCFRPSDYWFEVGKPMVRLLLGELGVSLSEYAYVTNWKNTSIIYLPSLKYAISSLALITVVTMSNTDFKHALDAPVVFLLWSLNVGYIKHSLVNPVLLYSTSGMCNVFDEDLSLTQEAVSGNMYFF